MNKIVIHDYAGHPFQFELSEELSKTQIVYHLYFKNDKGPKASFITKNKNLRVEGLGGNINYSKKKTLFTDFLTT